MFRKFILFAVFLALIVMVLGAYVRVSNAGLGCPDWPGCYGQLTVPQNPEDIAKSKQLYPNQPLEAVKAWKEMGHRYLAGILGIVVILLTLMSWWVKERRLPAILLSQSALVLVVFQALLGMWAVKFKVMPLIVMGHLLMGFATLATLYGLYLRTTPGIIKRNKAEAIVWGARIGLLVLVLQIALGGWMSANYAALACQDFPTCEGKLWPQVDYLESFRVWQGVGPNYQGGILSHDARVGIHWMHRVGALVAFVVLAIVMWVATSNRKNSNIRRAGSVLSFLLMVQVGLGVAAVVMRLPTVIVISHNAVAGLLLLNLLYLGFASKWVREALLKEEQKEVLPEERAGKEFRREPSILEVETEDVVIPEPGVLVDDAPKNLYQRLKNQLGRTRTGITGVLANVPLGKAGIDEDILEDIETSLLMADLGVETTAEVIETLTQSAERHELKNSEALTGILKEKLQEVLRPCSETLTIPETIRPFVILVVGVNGVGKTTMIGKLAKRLQQQGHSVMLAAGDTFRAAAVEQLQAWGERNQIPVVAQHTGADAASVIFDAFQSAQARQCDVLIADTAGRLHTKSNLMEELKKIKRIMGKLDPQAPHEVLLVLDAGTGQNAVTQAQQFNDTVNLTGLAITKLDGTAKGGVVFALAKKLGIPIRFIGVGEGIDDLQDFNADSFVDALLD
ncbi:MAG: signal recognition particle-docking protein FtsY [Methylococcales bacterium]